MVSWYDKFRIREFVEERTLVLLDSLLLTVIVTFKDILLSFVNSPSLDFRLVQVIILIFTIIAFTLLSHHLYLKIKRKLKEDKKETTIDVYSQNNLDTLSNLLSNAKEVWLLGLTLQGFQQITTTLKTILSNKGIIQILICDPNHKMMNEIEKIVYSTIGNHNTSQKINTTLTTFTNIMNDSNDNFQIRKYKSIPTNTMIIVNPNDDSGFMQVEPYLYGIDREDRRVFKISKINQKKLFDVYKTSFQKMWKDTEESINQTS